MYLQKIAILGIYVKFLGYKGLFIDVLIDVIYFV